MACAYGEIKRMMVDPARRGRGIGEQIAARRWRQRCASDGIGLALLETGRDQVEAVRLYERCGYRAARGLRRLPRQRPVGCSTASAL